MSDATKDQRSRRLHRILRTPIGELIRGGPRPPRVPRLRAKARIDASELPAPVKELVHRVVRRTRLWRREQIDVADELLAHFYDGVAAGESTDDLIAAFGDERAAATLIRRAKRRNRSLFWKAKRAIGWALVALACFYLLIGVYFAMGRPSPSVDYVALLNAKAIATPEDERAWPTYRRALLMLKEAVPSDKRVEGNDFGIPNFVFADGQSKRWLKAVAWLTQHAAAIELLRQGTTKAELGFVAGAQAAPEDWPLSTTMPTAEVAKAMAEQAEREKASPTFGSAIRVVLPHLNEMRTIANVLAADCVLARQQGDADRARRNLVALLGLSAQVRRSQSLLVTHLVAIGIEALAVSQIEQSLRQTPSLFDDRTWSELAHRLAGPTVAADLMSFDGERMLFYDIVQRSYTDDGDGDGRLTPAGVQFLTGAFAQMGNRLVSANDRDTGGDHNAAFDAATLATGPLAITLTATRKQLVSEYDRLMDMYDVALRRPLRDVDPAVTAERQVIELRRSLATSLRYAIISNTVPALSRSQLIAERCLGVREGAMTGIALELYRREHGRYPDRLDELSPRWLPKVFADRIDGTPVRYRLQDGRPLIYSVGVDRDDDGGRPALLRGGTRSSQLPNVWVAAEWNGAKDVDGDWILYPQSLFDPPAVDTGDDEESK